MSVSRDRMLDTVASTKRRASPGAVPVAHLSNIRVMAPVPKADPGSGYQVLLEGMESFADATNDISPNDILVIGSTEYSVNDADVWPATSFDAALLHLDLGDVRR